MVFFKRCLNDIKEIFRIILYKKYCIGKKKISLNSMNYAKIVYSILYVSSPKNTWSGLKELRCGIKKRLYLIME